MFTVLLPRLSAERCARGGGSGKERLNQDWTYTLSLHVWRGGSLWERGRVTIYRKLEKLVAYHLYIRLPLPSPLLHSTPVRTSCWVKCCNKSSSSMLTNSFGKCPLEWAVVLAQLVERLLPTLAVCGLNPVIGEFLNRTFVYIAVLKRQN